MQKHEKAIAWLNEEIRSLELAPELNGCPMTPEWAVQLDIMRTCLEAVQDHFPDTTKMMPLTLEKLREMDGKQVWMVLVDDPNSCEWMIVCAKEKCCEGKTYIVDFSNIGNLWLAYAYPPAHIDREAWKPCDACYKSCGNCGNKWGSKCLSCKRFEFWKPMYKYCKQCGRPLTEEAWAELEKRLRGTNP